MQRLTFLNFQISEKFTVQTDYLEFRELISILCCVVFLAIYIFCNDKISWLMKTEVLHTKQVSHAIPACLHELKRKLKISFVAPFGSTERTVESPWMFGSFPLLDTNLSHVLKYIQSILLPVKCCRLKLIVRANHLYSPLAWDWKKCDPVTLAATVFFCRGKVNILVCKAVLPCSILALSLSYSGLFSSTIQILVLWWARLFKGRKFPLCDGDRARVAMHGRSPHLFFSLPWIKQRQNT